MCGIAGYVCKDEYQPELDLMFPLLGVFMQDRGAHSWGYTDGVNIEKHVGALTDSYGPQYKGAKQAALHTRHATQGERTAINSHPWEFDGGLIGMHNGIVYNHKELNAEFGRRFEVDSMHIFQHIVEGRDLSEIEAYGAIVYWHEGKVWLSRFNGGELSVARAPWGIVYASTEDAISSAFRMAGLPEPTYYRIDAGCLYFIENGILYATETKVNIAASIVTTKWDDVDWKTWQGGSWLDEQGKKSEHKATEDLTVQSDLPSLSYSSECADCHEPFIKGDERWFTPDGWLCGYCATHYNGNAAPILGKPAPEEEEKGQYEYHTTVGEWLDMEYGDDPNDFTLACDGCDQQLMAHEDVYIESDANSAEELYCLLCKEAGNTHFSAPVLQGTVLVN